MAFIKGNVQRSRADKGDFEFIAVPPKTGRVVLTDRGNASLWLLTWSTAEASPDGLGYISILQPVPDLPDKGNLHVYGPFDGPYISWVDTPLKHTQGADPRFGRPVNTRLFVRDGYLGFETVDLTTRSGRTIARKGVQKINREIIRPSIYDDSGQSNVLAWRDMEF